MGITLDKNRARFVLARSLVVARSDAAVPEEWTSRTATVSGAPSMTFVPMLGTALLAKATNPQIDARSLAASSGETGYSARGLCKDVLVPFAIEHRIDIRNRGREPLNNQPFYAELRVDPDLKVTPKGRPHLLKLIECLDAVNQLTGPEAEYALAAFLRYRLATPAPPGKLPTVVLAMDLPQLVALTTTFVITDPEGGRRGQAFVAAALDLVFDQVHTAGVNDPSRHVPGDVVAQSATEPITSAEVKQRPATESEILQFADNLQAAGIRRGLVALLDTRQPSIDPVKIAADAWERHGVQITLLRSVAEVLDTAVAWSPRTLDTCLQMFPTQMAQRLRELQARPETVSQWLLNFEDSADESGSSERKQQYLF